MKSLSRRNTLKVIAGGAAWLGLNGQGDTALAAEKKTGTSSDSVDQWARTHNRVWLGGNFWANPMENWRIVDGAAECQSKGGDRSIHLITHQLTNPQRPFSMSVQIGQVEKQGDDGGAGFRIGVRSDINEYRSNCFAGNGWNAGVVGGQLRLGGKSAELGGDADPTDLKLVFSGESAGEKCTLTLTALTPEGKTLGTLQHSVPAESLKGNIALVSNFTANARMRKGTRYRFRNWTVAGDAFTVTPERAFGPILWSMHTLSDSRGDDGFVLKMTALTGPLGEKDNHKVELQIQRDGQWKSLGHADLDTDAWTATFRVPNWDEKKDTPYRLVYSEQHTDGTETANEWTGTVRANPTGRPLRFGALTCQNDYAFPYEPVAENLLRVDPDMLYFSGDQLYENHGGYGIVRDPAGPAILNYLRKFYQFGWSFREAMRDRPTLCIPDDHDVFHGNLWGEAGAKMKDIARGTSSKGGYRQPARMVNAVHRTCVSHHPDTHDNTPVKQNISTYHGDMVYGGVGFAIIADRQWKSGPERVDTGGGRADHVADPDFDTAALDKPGLILLGERQEKFLEQWADDWRGHTIKVLLSQTVFAGVATHHGGYDGYLKADLDCGGWPQTPRDRAVKIIRRSKALHINGDQHLTTLCQYGVEKQRDSNWSYCSPAIAVGYPRWWRPDELQMPHENRPQHGLANTGEFIDGLGNLVYVYAVGNPEVATKKNRYERAHQKGSGFGLVTIDPEARTYHIDSFRFLIDATDGKKSNQFPGWPVTIHQEENIGKNRLS